MDSILKFYPQYTKPDRRQDSQPVTFERRSGADRRERARALDDKLSSDIKSLQGAFEKFDDKKLKVDTFIKSTPKHQDSSKILLKALSPITPIRRVSSIGDNIENGNYERAVGLAGLALVNLPEDTKDLKSASKQIGSKIFPNLEFKQAYDYKNYQHPFSFVRGTFLEPVVNKMGKVGEAIHKADKTLFDTKLGEKVQDILNIEVDSRVNTSRIVPKIEFDDVAKKYVINDTNVKALCLEGSNFAKFIGRTMMRIPVLSVLALGILEVPAIAKSFSSEDKKIESGLKQTAKSAINVASIIGGIAVVGEIAAKKGPAGSLIGMGLGSIAGAYISKKSQELID